MPKMPKKIPRDRRGPYNKPKSKPPARQISIPTGPGTFLNNPELMTEIIQNLISNLEVNPFDSTIDDKYPVADQTVVFEKLGKDLKLETNGMGGGGILSAMENFSETGKNIFLGVYATYLKKPVEKSEEAMRSLYPKIIEYLNVEKDKFINLDSDSQVLRAIKIFITLSTIYTMAPYAVGGAAAATPIIMGIVSKTAVVIIPLLPTIIYYLANSGFLVRYGAGYYSIMAIVNFFYFPQI